jgi:SAM-dependent methyltransferase
VDRYYLGRFLTQHRDAIRGVVGEVSESRYVEAFGGGDVARVEVIDIDPENPRATIVADLAESGSLPSNTFDCLLILQTLQYTSSFVAAAANCVEALRPGGSLVLALPGLTAHDPRIPLDRDRWRFLPAGAEEMLRQVAPHAERTVVGYGNLISALAFLHGVSAEELRQDELAYYDPRFPVLTCARLVLPTF